MSEFGLRINNFAAGSIMEKNIGVRLKTIWYHMV